MTTVLLISSAALWLVSLLLGFLLLGTLQNLALLRWRLEQLEATTPRRIGRDGLKCGKKAPDFTLPSAAGAEVSLHDFAGRRVLLVFTQSGCSPCHAIVPELHRLGDEVTVLVVNNGAAEKTQQWATEVNARFPVLMQDGFSVSRRYEAFATPFAFLIDEQGVIRSKGIVNNRQHLGFVLSGAGEAEHNGQAEAQLAGTEIVQA
jgi:methylamine dehydrogenase accessory protein MauD